MKKIALLLALSMSAASLSGCGFIDEFKKSYKEALKESIKEEIALPDHTEAIRILMDKLIALGIIKSLDEIDAVKVKTEHQEDRYFNSPVRDFAQTDEALRIRETKSDDKHNLFITYKGPKIDAKSKTRKEVEMEIEDADKASKIFENLGFKEVRTVIKDRE